MGNAHHATALAVAAASLLTICCFYCDALPVESTENVSTTSTNGRSISSKVRVNVLYLASEFEEPITDSATFRSDSAPKNYSRFAVDDYNSNGDGYAWLANDRLQNVEVHILYRYTMYAINVNMQRTFGALLDLMVGNTNPPPPPVCNCNGSSGNSSFTPAATARTTTTKPKPVVHLLVGPGYSAEVKAVAQLTSFYHLALISGQATSPLLSDRTRYPYFFRTCSSDGEAPGVMADILNYFGYNKLTSVYRNEAFLLDLRDTMEPLFRARHIDLEHSFVFNYHSNTTYFNIAKILGHEAASHAWLLLVSGSQFELLCALYQYGNIRGSNYFLLMYGNINEARWLPPAPTTWANSSDYLYLNDCSAAQVMQVMQGALNLGSNDGDYLDREADFTHLRASTFKSDVVRAFARSSANGSAADFTTWMYYEFDALTAAAIALDRAEHELNTRYNTSLAYFHYNDSRAIKTVVAHLSNLSFMGVSGQVEFSTGGDRAHSGWRIRQFQGSTFVDVGVYETLNATAYNITFLKDLRFATADGRPPPQFPKQQQQQQSFFTPLNTGLFAAALVALLVIGLPLASIYLRRYRNESVLRAALGNRHAWLLDACELVPDVDAGKSMPMLLIMRSAASTAVPETSSLSMLSAVPGAAAPAALALRPFQSYKYKGAPVALFVLQRQQHHHHTTVFDREFAAQLVALQTLSTMAPDSLSRFVGVVLMPMSNTTGKRPKSAALAGVTAAAASMHLVMANTPKGTLFEFLEHFSENHAEQQLDEPCCFSFVRDLHRGMTEIHKYVNSHGRLSSTVCMIDNRLSLRVSDYGFGVERLPCFYFRSANAHTETQTIKNWQWSAPEVLQVIFAQQKSLGASASRKKTSTHSATQFVRQQQQFLTTSFQHIDWQRADVYSLGIVLSEIFTQREPFEGDTSSLSNVDYNLKDFVEMLQNDICTGGRGPEIINRSLETNQVPRDIAELILSCVATDRGQRPTLADVGGALRTMMKARKLTDNLTEMLMQRLETYANNLASLVEQRTQALAEEEMKVRRLLYQILPPSVADALKNGESIPPQTYESVTVYFSDIVGFTTISAQSTPLEVVDLLNDLYNSFDQIISKFDVYKVETIGDAYMVVSGLPTPNGLEHVRCIVHMSLALIEHVTSAFRIRHRPDEQLRLRIGMHTGPCAAGVVGFVMPRYCLFGDTVNTASRMESNGEPLRIHASEASALALQQLQKNSKNPLDFVVESRGLLEIKGKGAMTTYWISKH